MTYFLDANIISYVIKNIPSVIRRLTELIQNGDEIKIPIIAYYEVKRGLLAIDSVKRLAIFNKQIESFGLVQVSDKTFDLASQVYAKLKKDGSLIEDSDLFIGCSALEHDATLITNNKKHLCKIPRLQLEVLS